MKTVSINLKKKAKKIAINIAEATTTELLKELIINRIFRQKCKPETEKVEVPCGVVDRFKFFLNQFGELFQTGYSYGIYSIVNNVCSPFKESSEIERERKQLNEKFRWVEDKFYHAKKSLENFEKYGKKEFFMEASKHLYDALEKHVEFAKPLNELLLAHKPNTLKNALATIDRYYTPMRQYFNYLICEYYRFAITSNEYISFNTHQQFDMLLPDIPSKENLITLLKAVKEEAIPQ